MTPFDTLRHPKDSSHYKMDSYTTPIRVDMTTPIRERSISMGIRDREICNGILVLKFDGATSYFKGWLYEATAYFSHVFQRGQRLFWSTPKRDSRLYWDFIGLFHIINTGPEQIYTTGLTFLLDGDFNGALENFWPNGYGAIHYFVW